MTTSSMTVGCRPCSCIYTWPLHRVEQCFQAQCILSMLPNISGNSLALSHKSKRPRGGSVWYTVSRTIYRIAKCNERSRMLLKSGWPEKFVTSVPHFAILCKCFYNGTTKKNYVSAYIGCRECEYIKNNNAVIFLEFS